MPATSTRILIPSGVLGLGFDKQALKRGAEAQPDIICIDGGSTDSGPFYLGTGTSKYSRAATKSEWRQLVALQQQLRVPLVLTSCGTCGTDSTVDWMLEITDEVARELNLKVSVATVYSEQSVDAMLAAFRNQRIEPLRYAPQLSEAELQQAEHIVALAGAEPLINAIDSGADIILVGRATDTACIAALPLMQKRSAGAAWHGAKVAECGALNSTNPISGVVILDVDDNGFEVEPMAVNAQCTPHTVSAHMLYENQDPFQLYEPGGKLDVTDATYAPVNDRRVRVSGSEWQQETYSLKLEGAQRAGYQTTIMASLRDTRYVCHAKEWRDKLTAFVTHEIEQRMSLSSNDYHLEFRLIGIDSVLGDLEPNTPAPVEVGVLGLITSQDAETSSEIAKLINPFLLHFPLTDNEELPTFAFPYSPAQSERGPVYRFFLNHRLLPESTLSAFRMDQHNCG